MDNVLYLHTVLSHVCSAMNLAKMNVQRYIGQARQLYRKFLDLDDSIWEDIPGVFTVPRAGSVAGGSTLEK